MTRIIIPHALAADVLRALQDGAWHSTGYVVDAIDEARGVGDEDPGVGFSPVWQALHALSESRPHAVIARRDLDGTMWRLAR